MERKNTLSFGRPLRGFLAGFKCHLWEGFSVLLWGNFRFLRECKWLLEKNQWHTRFGFFAFFLPVGKKRRLLYFEMATHKVNGLLVCKRQRGTDRESFKTKTIKLKLVGVAQDEKSKKAKNSGIKEVQKFFFVFDKKGCETLFSWSKVQKSGRQKT